MPIFVKLTLLKNKYKLAVNVDHIMAVTEVSRDSSYSANETHSVTVVVLTGQLCYDVQGTVEEVLKNISLASGE